MLRKGEELQGRTYELGYRPRNQCLRFALADVRKRIRIRLADLLLGFQCSNLDAEYRLPSIVKEKKVRRTLAAASQSFSIRGAALPLAKKVYFSVTSKPLLTESGRAKGLVIVSFSTLVRVYFVPGQVVARCTVGGFEERYEVTRPLALESRRGALATRLKGEVMNTNSTERRGCEHKLD
ncbi:hypothetical protein AT2G07827 [Arabidopsis thaliana]|uniref:Uncharacterized protein n=1 Tax=Arabidopsis thaliana TaxID=3702 RepID=F4INE5_ARATH|nr:uncharacterized protein AT2G07827 [Arabidopsis thaliana]AEC06115.1 hypothetical protein AT2G07827 [Arabidopsis thaliana]|eukprot:NP_001154507.1 hypothetical protein AT2G07827 [Arabidopsis thaliana]